MAQKSGSEEPLKVRFPYMTDYINDTFNAEKERWDFNLLRPVLLILYFLIRCVMFPFKFFFHRNPYGFESRCIDAVLAFGMKYLATHEAAELIIRHVQIEPLLYRHLLHKSGETDHGENRTGPAGKLKGIDGDYNVDSLKDIIWNDMTVGHDELSYEILDRFDKKAFLENLGSIRTSMPSDHEELSKNALEENKRHSKQLLGATTVVMLIVTTITILGDLKTTVKALNSFDADAVILWCLKHIYENNPSVNIDLDFYLQEYSNRGHYYSSAFFSNPSQYLYYHIAFDEFAYELLRTVRPAEISAKA